MRFADVLGPLGRSERACSALLFVLYRLGVLHISGLRYSQLNVTFKHITFDKLRATINQTQTIFETKNRSKIVETSTSGGGVELFWGSLGPSWGALAVLSLGGPPGTVDLEALGAVLALSWGRLEHSWSSKSIMDGLKIGSNFDQTL